jgi:hypothetical protein
VIKNSYVGDQPEDGIGCDRLMFWRPWQFLDVSDHIEPEVTNQTAGERWQILIAWCVQEIQRLAEQLDECSVAPQARRLAPEPSPSAAFIT